MCAQCLDKFHRQIFSTISDWRTVILRFMFQKFVDVPNEVTHNVRHHDIAIYFTRVASFIKYLGWLANVSNRRHNYHHINFVQSNLHLAIC
jgi:hypothetical protein